MSLRRSMRCVYVLTGSASSLSMYRPKGEILKPSLSAHTI